ncbi:MAG TPA: ankyrin repeat domain-containing protein [Gammaproteobacteria bacterium]|nr:ankyrin repeat domain-containing protein [Gammaproteobacteria bacterium]
MKWYPIVLLLALSPLCYAADHGLDQCSMTGENPAWLLVKNNRDNITAKQIATKQSDLPKDVLTNAVTFGYKELVIKLLKDKKLVKLHGGNALMAAAAMGRLTISAILIKSGISPNAISDIGTTPIYGAVQYGCSDEVKFLIRHGANVNYKNPRFGPHSNTLMIEAIADRHYVIAAILLKNGYRPSDAELQSIRSILARGYNFSVWNYLFAGLYDERVRNH